MAIEDIMLIEENHQVFEKVPGLEFKACHT